MALYFVITILILFNASLQLSGTNSINNSQIELHTIHLVVLLPFPEIMTNVPNPSWDGGPNVLPAIRLAVDDINAGDVLEGFELKLLERNGGCNFVNRAIISFVGSVMYSERQIVGLIGPGCSASAIKIAPLTVEDGIQLINIHGAGTPKLEDHRRFPNSFGIFGSSQGAVATMIALMRAKEWRKVAVMYDPSRVFQSSTYEALTQKIQSNTTNLNINITSRTVYDDFYPLDILEKRSLRIVFVLAGPQFTRNLMCLAFIKKLTFPNIQWVIVERLLTEFQEDVEFSYQGQKLACSKENMTEIALNGSLLITYRLANLNKTAHTLNGNGRSYDDFMNEYSTKIEEHNRAERNQNQTIKISPWGSMYYDAIWAIAIALNNAHKLSSFDLNSYGINNMREMNATLELRKEIQKVNFSGVSGPILFNRDTGFDERPFDILQIMNNTERRVAYHNGGTNIIELLPKGIYSADEYPKIIHITELWVTLFFGSITCIIFVSTAAFHVATIYYRKEYSVRASSHRLSHLTYIGSYLLLLTSITYITAEGIEMKDNDKAILCHATYFLCSIGFTLIFGTMCAKIWRIHRIFNHSWKPGRLLSDHYLFMCILLATIGDIFINTLWISIDYIEIKEEITSTENDVIIIEKRCKAEFYWAWYCSIMTYNIIFIITALGLAIRSRKIRMTGFQTKGSVIMTYTVALIMGIGSPIQIIFNVSIHTEHILIYIADFVILNLVVIVSNAFLFIPPLYPMLKAKFKHCQPTYSKKA